MAKYRKKPVVIEAFCWMGDICQMEDPQWVCSAVRQGTVRFENAGTEDVVLLIDTLEGTMRANRGDYVIKGIKGELYSCKPNIFHATYEKVAEVSKVIREVD